jgi:hypothetical protein
MGNLGRMGVQNPGRCVTIPPTLLVDAGEGDSMTTALRPLSLGELLDRSFFLYRKHFALFVGIVALPHLALLAFQLLGVALQMQSGGPFSSRYWLWLIPTLIIQMTAAAASKGAIVVAVSDCYLDKDTTIAKAFAGVKGRILLLSFILTVIWIAICFGFLFLAIPGIFLALVLALVFPVAVLEDTGLVDSIARSWELTKGSRLRILVIYILYIFLLCTLIWLWEIPMLAAVGLFATRGHNPGILPLWMQIVFPVCFFLSLSLVTPLSTVALSLTYYDQKIRKEAFDLQHMMATLDSAPSGAATALPG